MNFQWNKKCNNDKNHIMEKYYSGELRIYKKGETGAQESRGDSYKEYAICKKCGMKIE